MTLSHTEEQRLQKLEQVAEQCVQWLEHAASMNMLNRLLVLCNEEIAKTNTNVTRLEAKQDEIITLLRKLQ